MARGRLHEDAGCKSAMNCDVISPRKRGEMAPHAQRLKESVMRTLPGLIFTVAIMAAAPAQAQTYDPAYPICLQTFGRNGNAISCGYISMAQCGLSASGRAAQCIVNPYYAGANPRASRRARRIQ